ncbi:MAG: CRISPR-associated protein Csm1 [Candidatus Marinimicrobia bacterium]|nr:CRISPR-associated protein Csm1 [Candidatus Neomarinimicrobiota bacterium]
MAFNQGLRENISMAALLHDIGKFWQRADEHIGYLKSNILSQHVKDNIADFCPGKNYSHKHALWTAGFFEKFGDFICDNPESPQSVYELSSHHHNASSVLEQIIKFADWISAGMDRSKDPEESSAKKFRYRIQRLKSVFPQIFREDFNPENQNLFYPVKEMTLDDDVVFPSCSSINENLYEEYKLLWEKFEHELVKIPTGDFNSNFETLLALLQKFTWSIPGSTQDLPDVSLYDHLKTTSAIALCLYDYISDTYPEELQKSGSNIVRKVFDDPDDKPFRLICGDLSGIQDFIYQITSFNAAKSLKGRSLAVQLMCQTAAQYILDKLDLPLSHLIYSAGGNFYILAPNTGSSNQALKKAADHLNNGLFKGYNGRLFLAIGSIPCSSKELMESPGEVWDASIKQAKITKHNRFLDQILNDKDFFNPYGNPAESEICRICGAEHPIGEMSDITEREDIDDENIPEDERRIICKSCEHFIWMGKILKQADYFVQFQNEDAGKNAITLIPGIPIHWLLVKNGALHEELSRINALNTRVYRLNNSDFMEEFSGSENRAVSRFKSTSWSFMWYGGNHIPQSENGGFMTFNELAESPGFKRLGILRMDIDSLGLIFKYGFIAPSLKRSTEKCHDSYYSISRLSTLSSRFDLFFSGYLNKIANPDKENLIIIYSGGDDLFLVGQWDHIVQCAGRIQQDFSRFTGYHPSITLSGGITLVPPKFPIHKGADLSGEAESQAKMYSLNNQQKNAITFLDKTLSWNDFFLSETMKKDIIDCIERTNDKGILTRLRRIHENYSREKYLLSGKKILKASELKQLVQYTQWRWRAVYDLERYATKHKEERNIVTEFKTALMDGDHYKNKTSDETITEFIQVPARWADYSLRNHENKEITS